MRKWCFIIDERFSQTFEKSALLAVHFGVPKIALNHFQVKA